MKIETFTNWEDMKQYLDESRQAHQEHVDFVKAMGDLPDYSPGDCVSMQDRSSGLFIIGKIEDPLAWYDNKTVGKDYEQFEYDAEKSMLSDRRNSGMVWGRWWSVACTDGELGSNSILGLAKIDEALFNDYYTEHKFSNPYGDL